MSAGYIIGYLFGMFFGAMLAVALVTLVIKGRKFSLAEMAKNPWAIGAGLLLTTVNLVLLLPAKPLPDGYNERENASFIAGCTDSAKKQLDRDEAGKFCACIMSKIHVKFSYLEYRKISDEMQRSGIASPEMAALAAQCQPKQ